MNEKIYQTITDQIVNQLSNGTIPWHKPWVCSNKIISHATGRSYSLLNSLLLEKPGEYVTFLQAQKEGGHIKKGAKSKVVYLWKQIKIKQHELQDDGTLDEKDKVIPILKSFCVFHLSDTEGLKPRLTDGENTIFANNPIDEAEKIIQKYLNREGIQLVQDRIDEAFYSPSRDLIQVPPIDSFKSEAEYYGTMYHEIGHSSGSSNRLNRFGVVSPTAIFGSSDYSKEELIAEMTSAFILARLGIDNTKTQNQNIAYIQSWIKALKNDPKMVVAASSKAERAVEFILGEQLAA